MRLPLPFLLFMIGLIAPAGCGERTEQSERTSFVIKAGIMQPANGGVGRLHETQRVTMDPARRPGWCFLVDPPTDDTYEIYSVTYLPAQPERLSGDFAGQSEALAGQKSATSRVAGIRPVCFDFDPSDPLGEYRIEVFINGARHSELRMEVVGSQS